MCFFSILTLICCNSAVPRSVPPSVKHRSLSARPIGPRLQTIAIIAAYAATVAIWGTTWLGIKVSLAGVPPITGVGLRFVLAGLVLYAGALALRVDLRRKAPPLHLVVVLALTMFGLNYALTYLAETHLASGVVAVLFGTLPFFTFGLAHFIVGERTTRRVFVGAALALGGVATISFSGNVRTDVVYVLCALVAAASSGFANVYLKRFAAAEPLATLPPAMLLAGAVMTVFGVAFEHVSWSRALGGESVGSLLYLAVFGSAIAFYLNHWLLQRISSGTMGLSALMIPVLAVGVGAAFGGEHIGPRDAAGALLVLFGIWAALRRPGSAAPIGDRGSTRGLSEPRPYGQLV
jgi:drug/metabolite transporter (DMT)-like permease